MAIQYVGARYVPLIYGEWVSGVGYEPLTIVTYLNNSYTSKKTVPATAGSPDQETDYWVMTGMYNGQIASLMNDVSDIRSDISASEIAVDHTSEMDFSGSSITDIASEERVLNKQLYTKNGWVYFKIGFARLGFNSGGTLVCDIPAYLAPSYDQAMPVALGSAADLTTNVPYRAAKIASNGNVFLGGNFTNSVGNVFFNGSWLMKSSYPT